MTGWARGAKTKKAIKQIAEDNSNTWTKPFVKFLSLQNWEAYKHQVQISYISEMYYFRVFGSGFNQNKKWAKSSYQFPIFFFILSFFFYFSPL